jgi:hypothetical protein
LIEAASESLLEQEARSGRARAHHERIGDDGVERDLVARRQRVPGRERQQETVRVKRRTARAGNVRLAFDQSDVAAARAQLDLGILDGAAGNGEMKLRVCVREL